MKKIFCFSLALLILTISILVYCPLGVFASYPDDYFSLSKPYTDSMGLSSSDAQAAVNAHKDIADSNGILCFQYTPTDSYNWTMNTKKQKIHLSDNQLKNLLMSKHSLSHGFLEFIYGASNSNAYRGFISSVGVATKTDSNTLLGISDKITGNYNYLNAIDYNEETQTITMSNDNSSVDKLREEIKKYYYNSIGLKDKKSNGTVNSIIDSSDFRACFEYEEDYLNAFGYKNYKYCLKTYYGFYYFFNDLSDYIYVSNDSNNDRFLSSYDNWTKETWRFRTLKSDGTTGFLQPVKEDTVIRYDFTLKVNVSDMYFWYTPSNSDWVLRPDWNNGYSKWVEFYSKDKTSLKFWSSYSALYNYLHGDQNAYLSSTIEKTGEDITFSIKDMNENLGNKMDALIDSINSGKGNMSADELQNAIDKGLEDLNKNTEDIKDNTSDILDTLKEQNNILLQILGVTEYIAYQNDKYNNTYTKADMSNLFKKSFNRVSDAVLYGEKVDDDNEETIDRTKFSYHNGIFGHFPFSVPYQLYEWLKVLQSEPMCPEFTYHYGFLIGISKDSDEYDKYKITFNLSAYDSWREVAASFLKLAFTLTMAIGTYKKFKGEL